MKGSIQYSFDSELKLTKHFKKAVRRSIGAHFCNQLIFFKTYFLKLCHLLIAQISFDLSQHFRNNGGQQEKYFFGDDQSSWSQQGQYFTVM